MNESESNSAVLPYYTLSTFRFIIFNVISFNLFGMYWMYKNWHTIKYNNNANLNPFWRSFFSVFFIFSFGMNIKNELTYHEIKLNWNPILLGIIYIVIIYLFKLPSYYMLLGSLNFISLIPIHNSMKELNLKKGLKEIISGKLNWWRILIIVAFYIFYFMAVIGSFIKQ
jgi:hypothetical protein